MLAPPPPRMHPDDHLGTAMFLAAVAHLLFILGVGFNVPDNTARSPDQALDITIIHARQNTETAEDAAFLSQVSQKGGAEILDENQFSAPPSKPTPVTDNIKSQMLERTGADAQQARLNKEVVKTKAAKRKVVSKKKQLPVKTPVKTDISQLLASTQAEIQRLSAELDEKSRNAANKQKRKAINASTQEFIYATYMDAWRKKVERIGNLNYPDEAKRNKLFGSLMLHVAVRSDGSVEGIRVVRSSGHAVLDDAAIRIVKLAEPFAAFPPEIRERVDVLDITRTWQFLNSNRLFSNN